MRISPKLLGLTGLGIVMFALAVPSSDKNAVTAGAALATASPATGSAETGAAPLAAGGVDPTISAELPPLPQRRPVVNVTDRETGITRVYDPAAAISGSGPAVVAVDPNPNAGRPLVGADTIVTAPPATVAALPPTPPATPAAIPTTPAPLAADPGPTTPALATADGAPAGGDASTPASPALTTPAPALVTPTPPATGDRPGNIVADPPVRSAELQAPIPPPEPDPVTAAPVQAEFMPPVRRTTNFAELRPFDTSTVPVEGGPSATPATRSASTTTTRTTAGQPQVVQRFANGYTDAQGNFHFYGDPEDVEEPDPPRRGFMARLFGN